MTHARRRRLTAVLPGLGQFQDYRRGWLRGDILAGLTVAAYLIPQVMAYAEVAGLSPVVARLGFRTTSTITRWLARFPACSSTATTPRCTSPTRRISANGP